MLLKCLQSLVVELQSEELLFFSRCLSCWPFWFSDVVTSVSHPGVRMAEPFVWVSAFFPHPFRHNEPIQMYWKEVRQPRGPGRAGDPSSPPPPRTVPLLFNLLKLKSPLALLRQANARTSQR